MGRSAGGGKIGPREAAFTLRQSFERKIAAL
jgi:hypothetical protein